MIFLKKGLMEERNEEENRNTKKIGIKESFSSARGGWKVGSGKGRISAAEKASRLMGKGGISLERWNESLPSRKLVLPKTRWAQATLTRRSKGEV